MKQRKPKWFVDKSKTPFYFEVVQKIKEWSNPKHWVNKF